MYSFVWFPQADELANTHTHTHTHTHAHTHTHIRTHTQTHTHTHFTAGDERNCKSPSHSLGLARLIRCLLHPGIFTANITLFPTPYYFAGEILKSHDRLRD